MKWPLSFVAHTLCVFALAALAASRASAQPPAASATPTAPIVDWSAAAGYQQFIYRDVARAGPPVDASPIAWRATGPTLTLRVDRSRPARLHRWDVAMSIGNRVSYASPLGVVDGGAGDRLIHVGGRYEYRRYLLANRLPEGVDVGLGLQGLGDVLSMSRHVPPSIEASERDVRGGGAWVAAVRLRRWPTFTVEATWVNGAVLARVWQRHSADAAASVSGWSGGWLTDTSMRADVRVARGTWLVVDYVRTGEGLFSTHHTYAMQSGRLSVGVRHGV